MDELLKSTLSKIARAEKHILDYETGILTFVSTNPYSIVERSDPKSFERAYHVVDIKPVPDEVATIAADALYNLRAALDYLAFHLVARESGSEPEWKVYFPIGETLEKYQSARSRIVKVVRQEVSDALDATEPYRGGNGEALWRLHELNRVDKHHRLLRVGVSEIGIGITSHFREMMGEEFAGLPLPEIYLRAGVGGAEKGGKLYSEPLDMKRQHKQRFAITISLAEAGIERPEPALAALRNFTDCVRKTVDRFRPFLG